MTRPARLEDLQALNALDEKDPDKFSPVLGTLLDDPDAGLLVAEREGKLCGYALAFKQNHRAKHTNWRVCWVEDLWVLPSKRKAGIGRELMTGVEAWARSQGFGVLALASPRAGDFYKTLGYRDSATLYTKALPAHT